MNELVVYDLYNCPSGLMYRVPLHIALYEPAEFYSTTWGCWMQSQRTVGGIISNSTSTLVARNVVFKD